MIGTPSKPALAILVPGIIAISGKAQAHASEQTFVLLLPTDLYTAVGAGIVALTIILLLILPHRISSGLFNTIRLPGIRLAEGSQLVTSTVSTLVLAFLVIQGWTGTTDPLTNVLPVAIWTGWWICLFMIQGILGNIWKWVNPFTGAHRLLELVTGCQRLAIMPDWIGSWPAVLAYVAFVAFLLADPAPDYPSRLAMFVGTYWLLTLAGMTIFGGREWLERCECFTILFNYLACMSFWHIGKGTARLGLPGWQLAQHPVLVVSQAAFVLTVLACSSFDGLNETFWWLDTINVNPLEFPGRSAVVLETLIGIIAAVLLLIAAYTLTVFAGNHLAGMIPGTETRAGPAETYGRLALSLLPIAFGYHVAHFFPTLLVNGQYAIVALSDPFSTGADYLGLGHHFVTTGFFAEYGAVRLIWLTQCVAIVTGHVLAVLVGHSILTRLYGTGWRTIMAEFPLSVLMILYTVLSLWLLASPRGA